MIFPGLLLLALLIIFWTIQLSSGFFSTRYYLQIGLLALIGGLSIYLAVVLLVNSPDLARIIIGVILLLLAAYHLGLGISKLASVDSRYRWLYKANRALVKFDLPSAEEFKLKTEDGVTLRAIQLSSNGKHPDMAVVVCHGAGRSKNTLPVVQTCELLATQYDVFTFDFRGHMESGGVFRANGDTELDLKAMLDYVTAHNYKKIAVVGWSIGAWTALLSAARGRHIDAIVAGAPPVDIATLREIQLLKRFGFAQGLVLAGTAVIRNFRTYPIGNHPLHINDFSAQIPKIPILLAHNDYDYRLRADAEVFDQLFQKLPTGSERYCLPGEGHLFDWPNTYFLWEKILAWLDKNF